MVCAGYRDPKQLRDLGLLYAAVVSGKDFFSTQLGKTDPVLPCWVELFEFNPNVRFSSLFDFELLRDFVSGRQVISLLRNEPSAF